MLSSRAAAGRTHLDVAREREVLPKGVTLEAVVCQDAPQVGVVGEEHAKHVPYLNTHTRVYSHCVCEERGSVD